MLVIYDKERPRFLWSTSPAGPRASCCNAARFIGIVTDENHDVGSVLVPEVVDLVQMAVVRILEATPIRVARQPARTTLIRLLVLHQQCSHQMQAEVHLAGRERLIRFGRIEVNQCLDLFTPAFRFLGGRGVHDEDIDARPVLVWWSHLACVASEYRRTDRLHTAGSNLHCGAGRSVLLERQEYGRIVTSIIPGKSGRLSASISKRLVTIALSDHLGAPQGLAYANAGGNPNRDRGQRRRGAMPLRDRFLSRRDSEPAR